MKDEKTYSELVVKILELEARLREKGEFIRSLGPISHLEQGTNEITGENIFRSHLPFEMEKDEFISIASHELKTPVTSMKGYVQVLQATFSKQGNQQAANMLSKVDRQINKLTLLIRDLVDVQRIDKGLFQYRSEKFDFDKLVMEVAEEMKILVPKNHKLETKLSGKCVVEGDRNKIAQVITNFVENASKYSPSGTSIQISTQKNPGSVLLSVKDFGIGIPQGQSSRVFERFFRVKREKENTYAGLGLGLYISSEIIKRHHGKIGVESKTGKGSNFYFELPL